MQRINRKALTALAVAGALALSACGGGGNPVPLVSLPTVVLFLAA